MSIKQTKDAYASASYQLLEKIREMETAYKTLHFAAHVVVEGLDVTEWDAPPDLEARIKTMDELMKEQDFLFSEEVSYPLPIPSENGPYR